MARFDLTDRRVWVAGHRGWSAPPSRAAWLAKKSTYRRLTGTPSDLRRESDVAASAESHRPQVVILAAAKVGGILANASHPVDFLEDNLAIELAVIGADARYGVEKLVFLGSTCVYPKFADQSIREEAL